MARKLCSTQTSRTAYFSPEAENSLRYYRYLCCRDEHRVMFCLSDGTQAHLYDAVNDVDQRSDLAEAEPETMRMMFEEYAQKDAAGRLPNI